MHSSLVSWPSPAAARASPSASAGTSLGGNSSGNRADRNSPGPPTALATTGVPPANDSRVTSPKPSSLTEGITAHALAYSPGRSSSDTLPVKYRVGDTQLMH